MVFDMGRCRRRARRRGLSPRRASRARERSSVLARRGRLRPGAHASAALEAMRFYTLAAALPQAPGGALGDVIGRSLSRLRLQRRDAAAARAVRRRHRRCLFGMSWLRVMERIGAGVEGADRARAGAAREERCDREIGEQAHAPSASRSSRHSAKTRRSASRSSSCPPAPPCRSPSAWCSEKQRPLFTDMPDSPLPPLVAARRRAAARSETVGAETLEFTSRLIERKLADFGVEVKVRRRVSRAR